MKITTEVKSEYNEFDSGSKVTLSVEIDGIYVCAPIVIYRSNDRHAINDLLTGEVTLKELYDRNL